MLRHPKVWRLRISQCVTTVLSPSIIRFALFTPRTPGRHICLCETATSVSRTEGILKDKNWWTKNATVRTARNSWFLGKQGQKEAAAPLQVFLFFPAQQVKTAVKPPSATSFVNRTQKQKTWHLRTIKLLSSCIHAQTRAPAHKDTVGDEMEWRPMLLCSPAKYFGLSRISFVSLIKAHVPLLLFYWQPSLMSERPREKLWGRQTTKYDSS